jgi:hypothetical protein
MPMELHQTAVELLHTKFDIKFAADCRSFDLNPEILLKQLQNFQSREFEVNEKILLVHMDTDYYDPLLAHGLIPINVIRVFRQLDISLHALLFVTNHFGISKEFDQLLHDQHPNDRPTIIETLLSNRILADSLQYLREISFDQIRKHAICMMNAKRSHRVAFYNFLVSNGLDDKISISKNFND